MGIAPLGVHGTAKDIAAMSAPASVNSDTSQTMAQPRRAADAPVSVVVLC
jgi:hypothetical protein